MTLERKRYIVRNLKIREISTVDHPAQTGAVAVLMKQANDGFPEYVEIVKSASAVAKGAKPSYSTLQYENAMLHRAELLGRTLGISPEKALAISLTRDSVLRELAQSSELARWAEYGALQKRRSGEAD